MNEEEKAESLKGAKDFLTLFMANERRLRNFTRILVYETNDADEVFQAAAVTMLEKFDSLTPDCDFVGWSCKIIAFKVMELRRKKGRERRRFSDRTVETLAGHAEEMISSMSDRSFALENCMQHLSPKNRSMLIERYEHGKEVDSIAEQFATSSQAVYRSLSRSRRALHDCISLFLANRRTSHA